ncbi:MAG: ROK family protein [Proteobacteria bacterium]|nr:ROK family protein [Pseudomonadota bacterium]
MVRIGIDVGGTKIAAIALGEAGAVLAERRAATPRDDYEATVGAITGLVHGIESGLGRSGSVGVGIPGAESLVTGRIKNANSVWLIDRPLAGDLARTLDRPVRLANDANCFALSEAIDGAAAGADVVFGVILGTGVGGGVVAGGRVLTGVNAVGGEWGHNPLPWPADHERPGPPCYCGMRGCIETFLSGPGLARDYRDDGGEALGPAGIAARAADGDDRAEAAMARYEDRLARSLATVINLLDPDVIVLGGGVSNIARLYAGAPARWERYVFSDRVDTRLVRARHGDASGARGAAWLWPEKTDG